MNTKICTKCGKELPLDNFPFRDKTKGTRRSDCKSCHNQQMREKYHKNKEILNIIKASNKCAKCGYDKCFEVLDYHHKDPETKINGVSKLITHSNMQTGLDEIEKCILLCANCHREFHFLERKIKDFLLEDFLNNNYNEEIFKHTKV